MDLGKDGTLKISPLRELEAQRYAEESFRNNEGENITLEAKEDSVLLVLSGEPINELIAAYGPFLMNTYDEVKLPWMILIWVNSDSWKSKA